MIAGMLAFAAGVIAVVRLSELPAAALVVCQLPLLVPFFLSQLRWHRVAAAFLLGLCWGILRGQAMLGHMLPADLEGSDLLVQVCVEGLPITTQEQQRVVRRFTVRLAADASGPGSEPPWPGRRVELSWYGGPELRPGQLWNLPLRLRAPRGFVNPGGYDRQAGLASDGIDAVGYVAVGKGREAQRLGNCGAGLDPLRDALRAQLRGMFDTHPALPGLLAVTLGDGSGFSRKDWDLFAATGTTHLMVISGMHIALVAGLAAAAGTLVCRRIPALLLTLPARTWGGLIAFPVMLAYAALAGMSVSVQRASIMCSVGLFCLCVARAPALWTGFAVSLMAVLLVQPLSAQLAGFWLSFTAVAGLMAVFGARLRAPTRLELLWRPQMVAAIALAVPLTLAGQAQAPLGPLINAVAIPLVDLLVVPSALTGVFLLPVSEILAEPPLRLALLGLESLQRLLETADHLSLPPLAGGADLALWRLLPAIAGAIWLLAPRGVPGRALGVLLILPLLAPQRAVPAWLDVLFLDVGQGSAVIVRTSRHTLVYDAGPRFSERFDAGEGIVAPALRALGVRSVDRLVLSHADLDHAGGARGLLRKLPVGEVLSGEPVDGTGARPCLSGQHWQWDGVDFRILHGSEGNSGNESSCVLRIEAGATRVLLTGDIGHPSERRLLLRDADALSAEVLLVPHHGSRGSSSLPFVQAVHPRVAVVSSGHRNRFGHPHPEVRARYAANGAELPDTARDGAVLLRVGSDGQLQPIVRWRDYARRFWFRD